MIYTGNKIFWRGAMFVEDNRARDRQGDRMAVQVEESGVAARPQAKPHGRCSRVPRKTYAHHTAARRHPHIAQPARKKETQRILPFYGTHSRAGSQRVAVPARRPSPEKKPKQESLRKALEGYFTQWVAGASTAMPRAAASRRLSEASHHGGKEGAGSAQQTGRRVFQPSRQSAAARVCHAAPQKAE